MGRVRAVIELSEALYRTLSHREGRSGESMRRVFDKDYSFCDATSFVVTKRLGIEEAIAFDIHFQQYGRLTLLR